MDSPTAGAVAAYVRGDKIAAICKDHCISAPTLMRWVRAAGVPRRIDMPPRRLHTTPEQDAAIAADYAAGMSRREITRKHGVSGTIVRRACIANGVVLRPSGRPRREAAQECR